MRAKWHGVPYHDIATKKWLISFETDETPEVFDRTKDKDLAIEVKVWRNKRSLDANNYFYVLVNKIAQKLSISDTEVHDKLLSENLCYICENGAVDWVIQDWEPNKYRLVRRGDEYYYDSLQAVRLTKGDGIPYKTNGKDKVSKIFWHVKGSHQMNTKEMARLIDSTVSEAKGLGIETLTPNELERMKVEWEEKRS